VRVVSRISLDALECRNLFGRATNLMTLHSSSPWPSHCPTELRLLPVPSADSLDTFREHNYKPIPHYSEFVSQHLSVCVTTSLSLCHNISQFVSQHLSVCVTTSLNLCHNISQFVSQHLSVCATTSLSLCHNISQFVSHLSVFLQPCFEFRCLC